MSRRCLSVLCELLLHSGVGLCMLPQLLLLLLLVLLLLLLH
jgi:hypothetical protein